MEINENFGFRYGFGKHDTCVNSSGINAMSIIPYNFWLQ